jgi:NAD(P)H-dependent FMN reductase
MKIQIILGSVRETRRGEKIFDWVVKEAQKDKRFEVEAIDLMDWDLPLSLDQEGEIGQRWIKKISEADGYILVFPEYNHGYSPALKLALDYPYDEWNQKPVGLISYARGYFGGIRAMEQLRLVLAELQMVVLPETITVPSAGEAIDDSGQPSHKSLPEHLQNQLNQLHSFGKHLTNLRNELSSQ